MAEGKVQPIKLKVVANDWWLPDATRTFGGIILEAHRKSDDAPAQVVYTSENAGYVKGVANTMYVISRLEIDG